MNSKPTTMKMTGRTMSMTLGARPSLADRVQAKHDKEAKRARLRYDSARLREATRRP